jgi:hypothetical protein
LSEILKCKLYTGKPYIYKQGGKYHVLQGILQPKDITDWHKTREEAISAWNDRVRIINK